MLTWYWTMIASRLAEITRNHISRTQINSLDRETPLFPTIRTMHKTCICHIDTCWYTAHNMIQFNDDLQSSVPLCSLCYVSALKRISDSWRYEILQQRIIFTRYFELCSVINSISNCSRCGVFGEYRYVMMKSGLPVCINCYEYSLGDRCRLAIMCLSRTPTIICDVKYHIILLLHRLFISYNKWANLRYHPTIPTCDASCR